MIPEKIDKVARWIIWLVCLFAVIYFGAHFLASIMYRM